MPTSSQIYALRKAAAARAGPSLRKGWRPESMTKTVLLSHCSPKAPQKAEQLPNALRLLTIGDSILVASDW